MCGFFGDVRVLKFCALVVLECDRPPVAFAVGDICSTRFEAISCAVGDLECKLEFIIIFGSSGVFTCRYGTSFLNMPPPEVACPLAPCTCLAARLLA